MPELRELDQEYVKMHFPTVYNTISKFNEGATDGTKMVLLEGKEEDGTAYITLKIKRDEEE